jgi:hypothetical protein
MARLDQRRASVLRLSAGGRVVVAVPHPPRKLGAVHEVELVQDVSKMGLGRLLGDRKSTRNLAVRQAVRSEARNLSLSVTEPSGATAGRLDGIRQAMDLPFSLDHRIVNYDGFNVGRETWMRVWTLYQP